MPETLKIEGKMNVHIISPTKTVLDDVADKILLPTDNGSVMILPSRAPLFVAVTSGLMWVYNKGQKPQAYYISDGIAEVRRDICSVLAWGVKAQDVDKVEVHERRVDLEEQIKKMHSPALLEITRRRIHFLKVLESKPSLLTTPDFD